MKKIKNLHATGVNIYDECPAKFYFSDVEGAKVFNKLPLALGTSVHAALQFNYTQKIKTKRDLEVDIVMDCFSDVFTEEARYIDKLDLKDVDIGKVKDNGIKTVQQYQENISPRIYPIAVEQKVKVDFEGFPFALVGTVDCLDKDIVLIDHKTTSNDKTFARNLSLAYERQVGGAYVILMEGLGYKIKYPRIDMMLICENPRFRHIKVDIDKKNFLSMFRLLGDTLTIFYEKGVEIFKPNRNSYLCTRRWCKYWNECEKKFGGRVKE